VSRALQIQAISARSTIWIATAYFTPSPSKSKRSTAQLATRSTFAFWCRAETITMGLDGGAALLSPIAHEWRADLEWQGEMMHAKTTVIDGRWVRVGSTDFNPLGVAINYELDAVIEDKAIGEQAEQMFLADLEESREVTL
jgi:cardiolipin synthase